MASPSKQKPAPAPPPPPYRPPDQALTHLLTIKDLLADARPIDADLKGKVYLAWLPTKGRIDAPEVLYFQSHLDLDTDGYVGPGQDDPKAQTTTSLQDVETIVTQTFNKKHKPVTHTKHVAHNVDANEIPYFVLPGVKGQSGSWIGKDHGIHKGDVGAIIGPNKVVLAEFADVGPTFKLGEASMEVHRELGHDPFKHRKSGTLGINDTDIPDEHGSSDQRFVTLVFPGSGLGRRLSLEEIRSRARALFEKLGGSVG